MEDMGSAAPPAGVPPPQETTPLVGARRSRKCAGCCCCQTLVVALLTVCVVAMVLAAIAAVSAFSIVGYPWHASCKADWTFGKPCETVMTSIHDQMSNWTGPDNCAQGGEKCLYEITSLSNTTIVGTHTTPVAHYVDELKLVFMEASNATCRMQGYSRSKTWYAYLDSGTNYCNMRNLITGSGLNKNDPKFKEVTSDSQCTQYSSADCNKY